MKKLLTGLLASVVVAAAMVSPTAQAGNVDFNFHANNNLYDVIGTFLTADTVNGIGGYDILGLSGTVAGLGGGAITSLVANPNPPNPTNCCTANGWYITFDNVLFPSASPQLDMNGIAFNAGGNTWNIFGNANPLSYELFSSSKVGVGLVDSQGSMSFTPTTPVPEPETYALMLAGLGLLGFVSKRGKMGDKKVSCPAFA